MSREFQNSLLIVIAIGLFATGFFLSSPIPQDPAYHLFADTRTLLSVDNFWNVATNLPLLIVGLVGLVATGRHGHSSCLPGLQSSYLVFFSGILLTAFGSAYYHLEPANGPLVWDRLPMTISFAGLFSIIIGEFFSVRTAKRVLIPLLLIGYASVEYWAFTESRGAGDLRPYAVVQFLPMLFVLGLLLARQAAIGSAKYWLMLLFYSLAKIFEHFDAVIFSAGELFSGHSLKHLFAAMIPATVLYSLLVRRTQSAVDHE